MFDPRLLLIACAACGRLGFAERAGADAVIDAREPIAFVQNMDGHVNTITANIPFGAPIGAHHTIIACFDFNSTSITAAGVSDSLGNPYTIIVGPFDRIGFRHYIALAEDSAPGPDTVAITASQFTSMQIYLHEYSGLARSGSLDQTATGYGTTTAVDAMATSVATTTSAPELIFGYGETGRAAVGTGFTVRSSLDGNLTEDRIVDSAGAYQATATMSSGADWSMIMATFH